MNITSKTMAAVLTLAAAVVSGQTVEGPVMGFVIDGRGHTLRPLLGVPGAAILGDAVKTPSPVTPEAVSPSGDYAVVWTGGREAIWTPSGSLEPIGQLPSGRFAVALSPRGTAAGFYSPSEGLVRVIAGLPGASSDISEFRLDTVGGACGKFGVSDDGALLLCSSGANAVVLGASGELARIPFAAAVTELAFVPGSHDALIADGPEAFLVRNVDAHGSATPLNAGLDTISSAAVTTDGRRALLADAGSRKVSILPLAPGAQATVLDCHCVPESLARINGSVYRLGGYSGSAMRLLDTGSTPPRIVVVTPSSDPGNSQ
jgi:hypothetical protein